MGHEAFDEVVALLRLEPLGEDRYRGGVPEVGGDNPWSLYGGHLIGQTLAAACATVESNRPVASLHAYFLRAGDPGQPVDFDVERTRDGASFSHRRVCASQGGRTVFELTASFQLLEDGRSFDTPAPDGVPEPESLVGFVELMASHETPPFDTYWTTKPRPMDLRYVHAPWAAAGPTEAHGIRAWYRAWGPLGEDPHLHACFLAYNSDESISDNALVPHDVTWTDEGLVVASLDHAMWFHRPFRADDWLLVDQYPIATAHGRGLALGRVWDRAGRLVATMTQDVLMRV
ncbi:MAG: thioesterase family protein [Acidimicrobiia bacterium]|nr:thioesterase family protein [Acidimicrobiia bacterium]